MSLKTKIAAAKRTGKTIPVPEWDCAVEVRKMSGTERAAIADQWHEQDKARKEAGAEPSPGEQYRDLYPDLLKRFCYDPETGALAFSDFTDAEILDLEAEVIERLAVEVLKLNGLHKEAVDEAGKGSTGGAQSGDSTSS